ncbi:hypothetical protein N330309_008 [Synechococcus phage S-CAM1]|uniref:Uncharacterized protein n=1 Tax=Synechococcus phage S-CAM1 TaxID=754037 RepID=A0A1D8KF39_9CAUD|nr:hypothetical protein N330309_008 [Synechococcus phage S-CAM1]
MNFNIDPPFHVMDPDQPWYGKGRPGGTAHTSNTWKELHWKLTGKTKPGGGSYTSTVKLSDADADTVIANMQKDTRGYPQFNESGLGFTDYYEALKEFQTWLVDQYLEQPFREQVDRKIEEEATKARVAEIQEKKLPKVEEKQEKADEVEEKIDDEAEEIVKDAEEEVKENLEPAVEVVEQAVQEVVQQRDQEQPDLSDIVDLLPPGMLEAVNKSLGSDYQKPEKKKREATGNVTNNRILKTVVQNLQKIQGQLDSIDNELKKQNLMISDAMATTISNLNSIETTHSGLNDKFDAILGAFEAQTAAKKAEIDERQGAVDEAMAEGQEDVADTFGTKKDDGPPKGGGGGRGGGLSNYLKRFAKFLWKRFAPKWLRSRLRLLRMKFAPSNLKRRAGNFLNRQKARAGNFLNNQKDRAGNFLNQQKDRLGGVISRNKERVGGFISRNKERAGNLLNKGKTNLTKFGDDAIKGVQRAASGVMRFGQRFGDDAIRYGKRGLAFVKNSPVAKRIAIATTKFGGRMVPVAGSAVSAADAVDRANRGDAVGAWLAAAGGTAGVVTAVTAPAAVSGVGAVVPAVAEAVSIAADTGLLMYDIFNAIAGREFTAEDQKMVDGVQQKEVGGLTKAGPAVLHGTEAIIPDDYTSKLLSPIGGALVAASKNFLGEVGPMAQSVAPMFTQVASKLTEEFDVPKSLARPNIGGSMEPIANAINNVGDTNEEDAMLGGMGLNVAEQEDLKREPSTTGGPLGMISGLWNNINNLFGGRGNYDGDGSALPSEFSDLEFGNTDDLRFGLTGSTAMQVGGWSHAHFENQDKSQSGLIKDTVPVVKKMVSMGMKPETSDARPFTKDMTDKEIAELIRHGANRHNHSGPKPYAVDINMPGFPKVPVQLDDVRNTPGKGEGINALIKGTNTAIFHLSYKGDGYKDGGDVGLEGQEQIVVGEEGPEKVMKNLVYSFQPVSEMLDAYNASDTNKDLIEATKRFAPEILEYDEEGEGMSTILIMQAPPKEPELHHSASVSTTAPPSPHRGLRFGKALQNIALYS